MTEALKSKMTRVREYLLSQMREASTWRGIAKIVIVAVAVYADPRNFWEIIQSPNHVEAFLFLGLLIPGLIGALFPDSLKKNSQ